MKVLSESKINIVNQIAAAICKRMCVANNCSGCPIGYLGTGIDSVFGKGVDVEKAIELLIMGHNKAISLANKKYDDGRYKLHAK